MNVIFERKTVALGWIEYRVLIPLPPNGGRLEDDDFALQGHPARMKLTKWILAYAAGIAAVSGQGVLEEYLWKLWAAIEAKARKL